MLLPSFAGLPAISISRAGHDVMMLLLLLSFTSAIFPSDARVSRECRVFSFVGAMVVGVVLVAVGELLCEPE